MLVFFIFSPNKKRINICGHKTIENVNNNQKRGVIIIKKGNKQPSIDLSNYKVVRKFSNKTVKELVINSLKSVK